jgi:hypothetical protein
MSWQDVNSAAPSVDEMRLGVAWIGEGGGDWAAVKRRRLLPPFSNSPPATKIETVGAAY